MRCITRAARSELAGLRGGALLVKLTAAPVDGAANAELLAVLAAALDVPRRHVAVIAGERSRTKRVLVEGRSPEALRPLLVRALRLDERS